jgi:hypothetical protein
MSESRKTGVSATWIIWAIVSERGGLLRTLPT